ncbi:MAG: toluene monooxygenase [Polyangiaceae bacterium]|nr:toluene monooxygenase [Polyangiaceae bacterium]
MGHERWHALARDLDWEPSYVSERALFPEEIAGSPFRPRADWEGWEEPYKTTFAEYVDMQSAKERSLLAVREAFGSARYFRSLDRSWLSAVKLHGATLALAEFTAVVGNLRAARFGRTSSWRTAACFGALDEIRHTQIPLSFMSELVRHDAQFDWTHRLYHTNNWVSVAARSVFDDLLLASTATELAVGANFVFETGFTNLQFVGLTALADRVGDHLLRSMLASIQTDEARHAQIGRPTLEKLVAHAPDVAQQLVDKWFWRTWLLFSVVTGITMDYLTPIERRTRSFKELVEEWVVEQFIAALDELGLKRPWYWHVFERSLETYHHMIYASAYSYRTTVWFDFALPGPEERAWLRSHYPTSWPSFEPVWDRITELWRATDPGVELAVHGAAIPTFCSLCHLVLAHGSPERNDACHLMHGAERFVFCSEPCRWIFEQEPERYTKTLDIVKRVLAGVAPGNLMEFVRHYSELRHEVWGKDVHAGEYPWLERGAR